MRKLLLITLCIIAAGAASGQGEKIERLLLNGNTEKAGKLVSKYKKKHPKAPEAYVWAMQIQLAEYETAGDNKKTGKLNAALREWNAAEVRTKGTTPTSFPEQTQLLKLKIAESLAQIDTGKQGRQARVYAQVLARLGDTTMLWTEFYRPAPEPAAVEPEQPQVPLRIAGPTFSFPTYPPSPDSVIAFAQTFVGTPYKWAGADPKGFDCSGFVQYVLYNFGYRFEHHTAKIALLGTPVKTDEVQKGDIVFFGSTSDTGAPHISHVGIIADAGPDGLRVIHSVNRGVCIEPLNKGYWASKIIFTKRIIQDYSGQYSDMAGK